MRKQYYTVSASAVTVYEEKKSRFIANVKPVASEEEAMEFISALKSKHWDAAHNVYAYYLGGDNVTQRFSDDGEPSGTAGLPVLEVIKRMKLQDVAVVVTRYFGGTLLGAAGLIRAYGKSASMGIDAAGIILRELCAEAVIYIEYSLLGKVQSSLASKGYILKEVIYGQDVEIIVYIPTDSIDGFLEYIEDTTNAKALVDVGNKVYISLDKQGKLLV